jgi:hypothetical protein
MTFRQSNTKLASATADAENVSLLTECSQHTGGARCLQSGVLDRKMSEYHGGRSLVLPECECLLNILCLSNCPTNKSNNAFNQGNVGAKDRA